MSQHEFGSSCFETHDDAAAPLSPLEDYNDALADIVGTGGDDEATDTEAEPASLPDAPASLPSAATAATTLQASLQDAAALAAEVVRTAARAAEADRIEKRSVQRVTDMNKPPTRAQPSA